MRWGFFIWVLLTSCFVGKPSYIKDYKLGVQQAKSPGEVMLSTKKRMPGSDFEMVTLETNLIYQGITGTIVHLIYREFSNDRARPAFDLELVYDLALSKEIDFRTITIRVDEATNQDIVYAVIEDREPSNTPPAKKKAATKEPTLPKPKAFTTPPTSAPVQP